MNPNAFQGTLYPDPCDFTMEVDRLVVREDSIVFDVHGMYDGECWCVEAGCLNRKENYFYGTGCFGSQDPSKTEWRVWLLDVSQREGECSIEGIWFEPDNDDPSTGGWLWTFGGTLQALGGDQ